MSTRKTTAFYAVLIAVASVAVGMVIASRMDLSPESTAQTLAVPAANGAPLTGPVDAQTFRNIAKAQVPTVVFIQTSAHLRSRDTTDQGGEDLLRRFFGGPASRLAASSSAARSCVSASTVSPERKLAFSSPSVT